MEYSGYSRAIIVLEEKNREFAARLGEEIKGYLRVETGRGRGAIRCVMQNVKPFPRGDYTYQLILFGKHGQRRIHTVLGTVPVSRFGTGEVYLRFRPQDVDGQGNDYSRYTAAVVAAVSTANREEQLHPVLMGETGHQEEQPRAAVMSVTERPAVASRETERTYNDFYGQYLKNVCTYLWNVPGDSREISPFAHRMTDVQWLKIDHPESMFLVSPGARYFAEKYGHFLLGRKADGENGVTYYVAVPGRFHREDQPDGGESGFVCWLPLGEEKEETGNYGYWILAICGETGEIFSPEGEK